MKKQDKETQRQTVVLAICTFAICFYPAVDSGAQASQLVKKLVSKIASGFRNSRRLDSHGTVIGDLGSSVLVQRDKQQFIIVKAVHPHERVFRPANSSEPFLKILGAYGPSWLVQTSRKKQRLIMKADPRLQSVRFDSVVKEEGTALTVKLGNKFYWISMEDPTQIEEVSR